MNRGEICWADLGEPIGSEPGFRRPVVIVQSNAFNESRINTVICVILTTNLDLAHAPGNVLLPKNISKLPKDSVINISQIVTLDKAQVGDSVSALPVSYLQRIADGLRLVLGM